MTCLMVAPGVQASRQIRSRSNTHGFLAKLRADDPPLRSGVRPYPGTASVTWT